MSLYLIRHGRPASTWGGDDPDPGLDEVGRAQAQAVARRLLALGEGERPRQVVSSPLRRCRQTAQPLADALGVALQIDPAVGEIPTPAGLDPGERPAWLRAAFGGAWADIEGDIDYLAWRAGVAAALAAREGAAVFSHFVAINAAVTFATGSGRVIAFRPDHTSVTVMAASGGALSLVALGAEAETQVL